MHPHARHRGRRHHHGEGPHPGRGHREGHGHRSRADGVGRPDDASSDTETRAGHRDPAHEEGRGHGRRGGHRGERGERQRTPRMLAHGDLRLLLLGLLEAQPRHGYELIQLIGEMFLGQYTPSAGAMYPALAQLQADGLVTSSEDGARRLHTLTEAGHAFARAHAETLANARLRTERSARMVVKAGLPAPVRGGMSAIKRALISHHAHWTPESGERVAQILLQAAADIAKVPHD
ncbi:PadR family transcriptional regulator [Pseudoxanthomonas sp. JBR18]|uniref:PadR family transcriptional regulator n=1 Tax=Pseudoxanthomonas sp. JBR18 TaxID=2969308 RepID=UPI0023053E40|nr:PadR family transcriptional regulator [Pseudoxanthomonas sp. JBR18]WCE06200.1 PadR family transcriptional regulator [Pseudoxanthomonas sp. JBR18]